MSQITGTVADAIVTGEFDAANYWGWVASIGFDAAPSVTVVLEGSGIYHRDQFNAAVSDSFAQHTIVGGLRLVAQRRARPYGQFLVGLLETRSTFHSPAVSTFHHAAFVFQPGAGVDLPITDHLQFRLAGDWIIAEPWYAVYWLRPQIRIGIGLTYRR